MAKVQVIIEAEIKKRPDGKGWDWTVNPDTIKANFPDARALVREMFDVDEFIKNPVRNLEASPFGLHIRQQLNKIISAVLVALGQKRPRRGRPSSYEHLSDLLDAMKRAGIESDDINAARIAELFAISQEAARQVLHRYRVRQSEEGGARHP